MFDANNQLALRNQAVLNQAGVFSIYPAASPGARKTSVILETIHRLKSKMQIGVIEEGYCLGTHANVQLPAYQNEMINPISIPIFTAVWMAD